MAAYMAKQHEVRRVVLFSNLIPSGKDNYSVTVSLDGFSFSNDVRIKDAYPVSYLEHGMLKSEVGEDFLDLIKDTFP